MRNFRQALASPHSGPWQDVHDPCATALRLRRARTLRGCPRASESRDATMRILTVALLSALLVAGCAARGVRIAELKDRPDKYEDKRVSVTGVVTGAVGATLLPVQFYNVDDGTGEITIVSRSGRRVPPKGARVQVKGKVNELASFGGRSIGLHITEDDRNIRD